VPFAGTAEVARRAAPVGLALLHVGAAQVPPLGAATLTLTAAEAAAYAEALGARHVAPLHFEGWRHFGESRAAAAAAFAASRVGGRVTWLEPGRAHTFVLGGP
jgi:L-ascorbate metabolism protein UlaG (beta-lactamase superfamily)